jgi:hypothetical protein
MDIKNLTRAQTTIDIIWAHFWCDPARFSSMVILRCGGRHGGSGEADEKPFRSTNTAKIPITCRARVASQPAGSIAFTEVMLVRAPQIYFSGNCQTETLTIDAAKIGLIQTRLHPRAVTMR